MPNTMAELASTPWVVQLALVLSVIGLLIATFMEQIQLVMKYFGATKGRVAWGYNLAMKVLVVNRLGAVCFLLFMGFSIDAGTPARSVTLAFAIGFAILTVLNLSIGLWFHNRASVSKAGKATQAERQFAALSAIAGGFNLLGFSIPLILGSLYPEFRLTLANLSFIFNSVCTVLIVFVIEHHMAKLIDENSERLGVFSYLVIVARAPASASISLALFYSLQWLPAS